MFWLLIKHYQLDISKINTIPMSVLDAHQALKNGEVDGLFRIVSLENTAVIQLLQNPQLQLIPIEQGAALKLEVPVWKSYRFPKDLIMGVFPLLRRIYPGLGARSF